MGRNGIAEHVRPVTGGRYHQLVRRAQFGPQGRTDTPTETAGQGCAEIGIGFPLVHKRQQQRIIVEDQCIIVNLLVQATGDPGLMEGGLGFDFSDDVFNPPQPLIPPFRQSAPPGFDGINHAVFFRSHGFFQGIFQRNQGKTDISGDGKIPGKAPDRIVLEQRIDGDLNNWAILRWLPVELRQPG